MPSGAQAELDRFCNALISIREEIAEIEDGSADKCAPALAAACPCLPMHPKQRQAGVGCLHRAGDRLARHALLSL